MSVSQGNGVRRLALSGLAVLFLPVWSFAAPAVPSITGPLAGDDGLTTFTISSEYQKGPNRLDVLLPKDLDRSKKYPVLYVLPVAAGPDEQKDQWGDPRHEFLAAAGAANQENLADKYGVICVFPVFDTLPWYGDNRLDPSIRQESYLLNVVIPLIDQDYPTKTDYGDRLLLGFSKSGWGALSLLLRHPDVFGGAAIFDAPLMLDTPGAFGSGAVFADQTNFDGYCIPKLLTARGKSLGDSHRIIVIGYANFRDEMTQAHTLMETLDIPHEWHDGPWRAHSWTSGWLPEAVASLLNPPKL